MHKSLCTLFRIALEILCTFKLYFCSLQITKINKFDEMYCLKYFDLKHHWRDILKQTNMYRQCFWTSHREPIVQNEFKLEIDYPHKILHECYLKKNMVFLALFNFCWCNLVKHLNQMIQNYFKNLDVFSFYFLWLLEIQKYCIQG